MYFVLRPLKQAFREMSSDFGKWQFVGVWPARAKTAAVFNVLWMTIIALYTYHGKTLFMATMKRGPNPETDEYYKNCDSI